MELIFNNYISGHDMDYYRHVSPSAYLKIGESAGFAAAERAGFSMQRMIDELDATWMTASVVLDILEDINTVGMAQVYADPVTVDGVLFHECICIHRDGRPIARCVMHTMAVNFTTRKVIRPEELLAHFGMPLVPGPGIPPRLVMPEDMALKDRFTVRYSNCDHNRHLRASAYADLVCDAADYWSGETRKKARHLTLEYLGECRVGETLDLYRRDTDAGILIRGVRGDGKDSFRANFVME